MNKFIVVIPARMKSKRLLGKPLIKINGVPMVIRTFNQCAKAVAKKFLYIATDSLKIKRVCNQYGANVVMTSKKCLTGTDRVAEVSKKINSKLYINVQGDEPIFNPNDLKKLINLSLKNPKEIISGYSKISQERMYNDLNVPKFVLDKNNYLLYATRAPVPSNKKGIFKSSYRQICAYSFPKDTLNFFYKFKKKTFLENIEDIELLRFIENGMKVKCIKMSGNSLAVDNSFDLNLVTRIINKNKKLYE
tara:strand:- start:7357 stop:8100 length:744 start_codon:yes stop_codon:yes gene_type:complete